MGQRRQALIAYLAERALHALGLDATTPIEPRVPLKELGLDSLMAVELRNSLARSGGQLFRLRCCSIIRLSTPRNLLARVWRLEDERDDASGLDVADAYGQPLQSCPTKRQKRFCWKSLS